MSLTHTYSFYLFALIFLLLAFFIIIVIYIKCNRQHRIIAMLFISISIILMKIPSKHFFLVTSSQAVTETLYIYILCCIKICLMYFIPPRHHSPLGLILFNSHTLLCIQIVKVCTLWVVLTINLFDISHLNFPFFTFRRLSLESWILTLIQSSLEKLIKYV